MTQGFKQVLYGFIAIFAVGLIAFAVPSVGAVDAISGACQADPNAAICTTKNNDFKTIVAVIVNTLLFLVGAIAVIMIIVGGIMYTTSGGDSGQVTKAKNTIVYSVVGLVFAALAYPIVGYVVGLFK